MSIPRSPIFDDFDDFEEEYSLPPGRSFSPLVIPPRPFYALEWPDIEEVEETDESHIVITYAVQTGLPYIFRAPLFLDSEEEEENDIYLPGRTWEIKYNLPLIGISVATTPGIMVSAPNLNLLGVKTTASTPGIPRSGIGVVSLGNSLSSRFGSTGPIIVLPTIITLGGQSVTPNYGVLGSYVPNQPSLILSGLRTSSNVGVLRMYAAFQSTGLSQVFNYGLLNYSLKPAIRGGAITSIPGKAIWQGPLLLINLLGYSTTLLKGNFRPGVSANIESVAVAVRTVGFSSVNHPRTLVGKTVGSRTGTPVPNKMTVLTGSVLASARGTIPRVGLSLNAKPAGVSIRTRVGFPYRSMQVSLSGDALTFNVGPLFSTFSPPVWISDPEYVVTLAYRAFTVHATLKGGFIE